METIRIPNLFKYNSREKSIINDYHKGKNERTVAQIDRLKKTSHERLFKLIKMHCLVKMGQTNSALAMTNLFFPFIRKDEVDFETFLVFSELFETIGFRNLAQYNRMLYHSLNEEEKNADSVAEESLYNCDSVNMVADWLISKNKMLELGLVYLNYPNNGLRISDELQFIVNNNYNFALLLERIRSLVSRVSKVFVIVEENDEFFFLKKLFNGLAPNIDIIQCDETTLNSLDTELETNVIIGKSRGFLKLMECVDTRKRMEVFFENIEDLTLSNNSVYLYGNYFKSMYLKYNYDFSLWKSDEYEHDFSIVIPVRNDGKYLPYAIKACLNQTYRKEFEILISDNSDINNDDALRCVKKFSDKRIRYIRTPQVLPLNKSFEFAYFNSKGKYILSIGSDDSIMDYSLDLLSGILSKKEYDVVSWGNARYEWPSKANGKKANLMIRRAFFDSTVFKSSDLLDKYYVNNLDFGYMPKLYLGTCFSRALIQKFLSETGKFEDGYSQDIYTGVKTALLEDSIFRVGIPLTVSGVSSNSTGRKSVATLKDAGALAGKMKEKAKLFIDNTFYCLDQREMIDNMSYMKSFSLLEYSEILKANGFPKTRPCANPFIGQMLTVNPKKFCDMDFIISGLLKYDRFYNGRIYDDIVCKTGFSLKSLIIRSMPQQFVFFFYNHFKKVQEGYNTKYYYGKRLKNSTIIDGTRIVEHQFREFIKDFVYE